MGLVRAWVVAFSLLAAPSQAAEIVTAKYAAPTTRYTHGVLGDAVEWGAIVFTLSDGARVRVTLPQTSVFEDLAPRLADVDLDGDLEAVVVEASVTQGARLAIYDATGLVAATPHIGRSNRWLAPVAVADLDGDERIELAYVDRPHLAKTLRVWRFENGRLVHLADQAGVTNHRIGWDFIIGGLRDCGAPEMILASGDWRSIVSVKFERGAIATSVIGLYTGPSSVKRARTCG